MLIKTTELFDISEDRKGGHLLYQNTEGKIWIFSLKNIRRSLIIYNPTSIYGRLLRFVFISIPLKCFYRAIPQCKIVRLTFKVNISSKFEFESSDCSIYVPARVNFSLSTIQVDSKIDGVHYFKYAESENMIDSFIKQTSILNNLPKRFSQFIPKATLLEFRGFCLLSLTSTRSENSRLVKEWNEDYASFNSELLKVNCVTDRLELLDYACDPINKESLDNGFRKLLDNLELGLLRYYDNRLVDFSLQHGDFTPWNCLFEKGKIFVFDWEHCDILPNWFDRAHFAVMTGIYFNYTVEQILSNCREVIGEDEFQAKLSLYLYYIINFYLRRGDCLSNNEKRDRVWFELIDLINEY